MIILDMGGPGVGVSFIQAGPLILMDEVEPWADRAVRKVGHREEESGDLLPNDGSIILQTTL